MTSTYKDNIGKEDIRQFGGNNRTFQRRNSAGALLTLHSVGNVVDVLQAYGDGTTPAQVDLSSAIVGANGNECAFELAPGTWPITSNLTIPATVTLILLRGATFSVSAGVTLTLSGPVMAQESTWYSGAGTVAYTAGGGFFPLVSDLAAVTAGKGAALIGATGTAKTVGDLFDGGRDVSISPLNIDAGGTLAVAGASTLTGNTAVVGTLDVTGQTTAANLSASGTLGGKLAFRGALVYKVANQTLTNNNYALVTFDAESYDTDAIHSIVSNTSRLTVPTGVTKVRLQGQVYYNPHAVGTRRAMLLKNGTSYAGMVYFSIVAVDNTWDKQVPIISPVLSVAAGEYFELYAVQNSGGDLIIDGDATGQFTWFAMEIVE